MKKLFISGWLAVFLFIGCNCAVFAGEEAREPSAEAILEGMITQVDKIKSYKLFFEYLEPERKFMEKGKEKVRKKEWRKCEFWFKGRDFIRLAVLEGDNSGNKVAFNAKKSTTKVYAKPKGMPMALPLSVDDKRLKGFFKSDWKSDLGEIAEMVEGGKFSYEGTEKLNELEADKIVILPEESSFDRIILWADKKDKVLLQYEY